MKNKSENKSEHEAQFIYYAGAFENNKPVKRKATVILLIDKLTGKYARGIALCNPKDNFCKKTGRDLALARARKALGTKRMDVDSKIRPELWLDLVDMSHVGLKTDYMPGLSAFEMKLYNSAFDQTGIEKKVA